jgi:transposase InsO family protein
MHYAGERVEVDVKVVPKACIQDEVWKRYYQYIAIDEFSRLRYLEAFQTVDTLSSAGFIEDAAFARRCMRIECVQTDNGFEFTKRFMKTRQDRNLSLFETVQDQKGIRHKLIKPYTPRRNGKVEKSHKEDQKRLYNRDRFFSFEDIRKQLRRQNQHTNKIPMRPLNFLSPLQILNQTNQYL